MVDVVYTVEALQCFPSVLDFATQAATVLTPGGRLAVAAHLCPSADRYARLQELIPTCPSPDAMPPVDSVMAALAAAGLEGVRCESIGARVFPGYARFVRQAEVEGGWSWSVGTAYEEGALDYYLIQATRPCL
jgi:hypothetical protein